MKQPFVSVIIPSKKISNYLISENLPTFKKQVYKKFEVIVLPNKKSQFDATLLKKYSWLRIIPTKRVTRPAEKRDIGVKKSKGEIIAFIDDDAYPTQTWIQDAIKLFSGKKIGAVCGPGILPPTADFWEKLFDEILKSWVGSGEHTYRFIPEKKRFVDDYPSMNFFILKKDFLSIGGFNNEYWPGEDSKLCEELVYDKNKLIAYSPTVLTYHHRRNTLTGFLKQHANYGFHRGAFFAHGDKNSRRISYLIPTLFVLYLFVLVFFKEFAILYVPLFTYLFFMLHLMARSLANTKNYLIAFLSPFVLLLTHIVYGILFVKGFLKGIIKKENIYE